jgi:hypothetical protein
MAVAIRDALRFLFVPEVEQERSSGGSESESSEAPGFVGTVESLIRRFEAFVRNVGKVDGLTVVVGRRQRTARALHRRLMNWTANAHADPMVIGIVGG